MSQATRARPRPRLPHVTMNSDGRRHPLVNGLAIFTLAAGVVSFAFGFVVARHVIASWIGLAALVVGFYAQLISATREQRIVIVTGLVAAFVGIMLAFSHGGLFCPWRAPASGPAAATSPPADRAATFHQAGPATTSPPGRGSAPSAVGDRR